MATKTPPFRHHPAWSEARFWGFIRSALRSASTKYPPKYEVLHDAKRPYKGSNKRQKYEYKCKSCSKWFAGKDVSVDHVVPAGTLKAYSDLPGFVERLFCGKEGLQVLCDTCHGRKTAEERGSKDE